MNCAICGSPLLFDRVVFHCSCGVYVHAYCWDKHVLQAHKPAFEVGSVDLNSQFRAKESELEEDTQMKDERVTLSIETREE